MERAPFGLTATIVLAVFLFVGNANLAWACDQKICLEDATCSGDWDDDCPLSSGGSNCASQAFTAACTGMYMLHAFVNCAYGCDACEVCAVVTKASTGAVVGSCGSECSGEVCDKTCGTIPLVANEGYILYVCRTPCSDGDCEDCQSSCRTFGCLCFGTSITCNP